MTLNEDLDYARRILPNPLPNPAYRDRTATGGPDAVADLLSVSADDERARRDFARILAEPRPRRRAWRRADGRVRRWPVTLGATVALFGVAAAAQAAGIIPDDVTRALRHGSERTLAADLTHAKLRATTTLPSGARVEFWQAPNKSGGTCEYLRQIRPGTTPDGSVLCAVPDDPSRTWTVSFHSDSTYDPPVAFGSVRPDLHAARLRAIRSDGRTSLIQVGPTGYFVGSLPPGTDTAEVPLDLHGDALRHWITDNPAPTIRTVEVLDATGRTVLRHDL